MVLEAPELVKALKDSLINNTERVLSRRTGWEANVDLLNGKLTVANIERAFTIPAVGVAAQELVAEGGLEQWVKNRL